MIANTVEQTVAKLRRQIARSRRYDSIAETCCSSEFTAETQGWDKNTESTSKKIRAYRNPDHHSEIVQRSQLQVADCEVARGCLEKRVNLVLGECPTYVYEPNNGSDIDDLCKDALEALNKPGHPIRNNQTEFAIRLYRDGAGIYATDKLEGEPDFAFLESCWICQPDAQMKKVDNVPAYNEEFWSYGIVARNGMTRRPLGVWVEGYAGVELSGGQKVDTQDSLDLEKTSAKFGFVSYDLIRHVKYKADSTDPRGVPAAKDTLCWSIARKALLNDSISYVSEQAKHATVRKLHEQVDAAKAVGAFGEADIAKMQHALGISAWDDGPSETTIKGEDLMIENIGSIASMLELERRLRSEIVSAWGEPQFMSDGDAGSGNRANMGAIGDAYYKSLNSERKTLQVEFVEMAYCYLESMDCDIEQMKENGCLSINWPPITSEEAKEQRECSLKEVEAGVRAPQEHIHQYGTQTPEETQQSIIEWQSGEATGGVPKLPDEEDETEDDDTPIAETRCGANAEGGGGFQKGNTCAKGSKGGRSLSLKPLIEKYRKAVETLTPWPDDTSDLSEGEFDALVSRSDAEGRDVRDARNEAIGEIRESVEGKTPEETLANLEKHQFQDVDEQFRTAEESLVQSIRRDAENQIMEREAAANETALREAMQEVIDNGDESVFASSDFKLQRYRKVNPNFGHEELERATKEVGLGSEFDEAEEIATLAGVQRGAIVDLRLEDDEIQIASSDGYRSQRTIHLDDGDVHIVNESFEVYERGQGTGSLVFGRQVSSAIDAGVTRIETHAYRSDDHNGYYTWPRLGYDADIPNNVNLPPKFSNLTRVSELMMTPDGRDFWRENGVSADMEFDLSEGSLSRKVLAAYLKRKGY